MVGTGILSNNMRPPSPECYMTFWMMTIYSDTLHWSGITPIFDPITDLHLISEFAFSLIASGFHRTFATVAECQQRTLTPPDTWSCPTFGTFKCSQVETYISWTCLVSGLFSFEHPSVLLFLLLQIEEEMRHWFEHRTSCCARKKT